MAGIRTVPARTGAANLLNEDPKRPHAHPRPPLRLRPAGPRTAQRGGVLIETALALLVVVGTIAGLMELASSLFHQDRLARAARAAAREISLLANAPGDQAALQAKVCKAIRRELDLEDDFDCAAHWTIEISAWSTPVALLAGTDEGRSGVPLGGEPDDLVRVAIGKRVASDATVPLVPDADAQTLAEDDGNPPDSQSSELITILASAVARNERAITVGSQ